MSEYSYKLPDLGEGIVESEVCEWHIQVGDMVEQDQHIADIQTDKAVIETSSPVSGKVLKLGCAAGEILTVGSELVLFETQSSAARADTSTTTEASIQATANTPISAQQQTKPSQINAQQNTQTQVNHPGTDSNNSILTSPSVRLRARQHSIDLQLVQGSGPKGRINHSDLDHLLGLSSNNNDKQQKTETETETENQIIAADTASATASTKATDKQYSLKGTRRIIAKKLQLAAQQIPHYSYVEEVDVSQLEKQREQLNLQRQPEQSKLSLLPFIMQALVKTLPQFPHCNAHFNNDSNEVTEFKAIHIGIATMTDAGLMVPVIKHCESLSLWQCAEHIEQMAKAARSNTINPQQLSGSTITITSLGKLGGIASTPIINAPETCIIGINKIQKRPVVIDDAIAIRSMMNISASFDHRIVDGFDGASMVQAIKLLMEDPSLIVD